MEKAKLIPMLFVLAMAGVGCSSGKTENGGSTNDQQVVPPPVVPPPPPPGTGDPDTENGTGTNKVTFSPVSWQEMNSYVAVRPLNNPSNAKVTVDLVKDSANRYSGEVRISYTDNGQQYEGVFTSGNALNSELEYNPYNGSAGWYEHSYNFWMSSTVFTGYFQDNYGGIILVIDGATTVNQGDGQGGETQLTGSIWYHNFAQSMAPHGPQRKCWYIYNYNNPNQYPSTVYDCRSGIMNQKSLSNFYPTDSYRKLGTFTGLSRSQAFK